MVAAAHQRPGLWPYRRGNAGQCLQQRHWNAAGNQTINGTAGAVAVGLGAAGAGVHVGGIADLVSADVGGGTVITLRLPPAPRT